MAKATFCPLVKGNCKEHRCLWFIQLRGTDKNTGKEIDDYGCAVAWLPLLLVENANETRHAAASVDSLRNATVKGEDATRRTILTGLFGEQLPLPLQIEDRGNGGT